MELVLSSAPFRAYALASTALVLKMLVLGWYGAILRGRAHRYVNEEDARVFGGVVAEADPPDVQRVLRALRNDTENIPAFLSIGLLFVLCGAGALAAWLHFGVFVAARTCFSIAYVRAVQPYRTASYVVATLALLAMMGRVVLAVA